MSLLLRLVLYLLPLLAVAYLYMSTEIQLLIQLSNKLLKLLLDHLVDWSNRLIKADPNKLIAIICRYPKQAMELKEELEELLSGEVRLGHRDQFSFEPGIMVTNIHQVKGLEFDSVALVEPDEDNYPIRREESRNMIYVGITRTQDDLLLTTVKPFSRVFFY